MALKTISSYEELKALVGQELGTSDWHQITQEQINKFADATLDHQWIHVDEAKAAAAALANARRFLEAGADSVKIELPDERAWNALALLRDAGIPVVGHLGLLPQTAASRRQCARTEEEADALRAAGRRLDALDPDAVVVEHVPDDVGASLAEICRAPVVGIGAGRRTDGQVLVFHDLLGLSEKSPPFAPRFVEGRALLAEGMAEYVRWVKSRGASLDK